MELLTLRQLILGNNTIQIKIPRCQIEFEVPQVCAYIYIYTLDNYSLPSLLNLTAKYMFFSWI